MKAASQTQIKQAIEALIDGPGYYVIPAIMSKEELKSTNQIIQSHSNHAAGATHFHGAHQDKVHLQRRVWNLLNKGDIFIELAKYHAVMEVFSKILGSKFILGSLAANRLLPGAPGQEPHIDYPYWDLYKKEEFPININASFHMNCQSLISLHDFTKENGATALVPYSQKRGIYPNREEFEKQSIQIEIPAGSMVLFTGLIWHCSMPNNSDHERTSLLGQYLPKFVKPMEDFLYSIHDDLKQTKDEDLRQILGLDLRYPEKLEDAAFGNAEGQYS